MSDNNSLEKLEIVLGHCAGPPYSKAVLPLSWDTIPEASEFKKLRFDGSELPNREDFFVLKPFYYPNGMPALLISLEKGPYTPNSWYVFTSRPHTIVVDNFSSEPKHFETLIDTIQLDEIKSASILPGAKRVFTQDDLPGLKYVRTGEHTTKALKELGIVSAVAENGILTIETNSDFITPQSLILFSDYLQKSVGLELLPLLPGADLLSLKSLGEKNLITPVELVAAGTDGDYIQGFKVDKLQKDPDLIGWPKRTNNSVWLKVEAVPGTPAADTEDTFHYELFDPDAQ